MPTDFWIAVLALAGTLIGSGGGILAASRLTNYRIRQLEKRVEKHNSVVERTALLEKEINVANHRIKDLEEEMRKN